VNPAASRWFPTGLGELRRILPGRALSSIKRDSPVGLERVIRRLIRGDVRRLMCDMIRRDLGSGLSAGERPVIADERVRGHNN
jgi:hypothetical protein